MKDINKIIENLNETKVKLLEMHSKLPYCNETIGSRGALDSQLLEIDNQINELIKITVDKVNNENRSKI